jgi:hypothetical protein
VNTKAIFWIGCLALASCDALSNGGGTGTNTTGGNGGNGDTSVVAATAVAETISQATVHVSLSRSADVAAACVRADDPAEVHLLESSGAEVDFRFAGLLAATDYTCSVAPTNPAGPPMTVAFRTPDPPPELASAIVESTSGLQRTGGYTLMNVRPGCDGGMSNYISILDPEGNNRWRYDLPNGMNVGIEVLPDGPNRFLWGGGDDHVGAPAVVDLFDGEQWKLTFPGSETAVWHHDARRMSDGRVLSVEETDQDGWSTSQLRLVDDSGNTSWFYDFRDAVAEGWLPPGDADNTDPHHLNWAEVVDSGQGNVAYASLCYQYKIVAIDVATSQLLWRFGAGGDFDLVDTSGQPLTDDDYPQCQHGLQMDGTHLLVYDNGQTRGYTRVVEYTLDTSQMKATKTWEWQDSPPYWEKYHGGADWLTPDHDRVLVAEANSDCGTYSERHTQIVEVDRPTGAVVERMTMKDIGDWIYRAHRMDGCDIFANAKYCSTIANRVEELRGTLGL